MNITQKAIAKKTKVSQSTVSLVLNGCSDGSISAATVKKVLAAAGSLGYHRRAVPLRGNSSTAKHIGHFIEQKSIEDFTSDPYYARFLSGLTMYSTDKNYNLVIYNNYQKLMGAIHNGQVDGLIIESKISEEEAHLFRKLIPAVLLNWRVKQENLDSVMPDNRGGVKKAILRLFSLGHRNIAFFGMKPFGIHGEERLKGYFEGLKECGLQSFTEYLQLHEAREKTVAEIEESAQRALKILTALKNRPTALIAVSDNSAIEIISQAHKFGISLPDELSIIGFDNRLYCRYITPTLSSIEQPIEEMGKKAILLLFERIASPDKPVENVVFGTNLIERDSICEFRNNAPRRLSLRANAKRSKQFNAAETISQR
jgi:LacI family transcriptional regulator